MKKSEKGKDVNKEIYEEVIKQLKPLFDGFYPTSQQYRVYLQAIKQIDARLDRMDTIYDGLMEYIPIVQDVTTSSVKFHCLMRAVVYLFFVQLSGNLYVNLTLLLLVGKGDSLHLQPDREHRYVRHAASLEDIESQSFSLSTKLDFLESNGLRFFRKWISTTLRNKIAHGDFEIDDKGNFFFVNAKGRRKKVDLMQKLNTFRDYNHAVTHAFRENVFSRQKKHKKPPK